MDRSDRARAERPRVVEAMHAFFTALVERERARPGEFDCEHRSGAHYCLGAPLARTEIRTTIRALLRRLPDVELAVARSEPHWKPDYRQHALTELPVTFTAQPIP